MGKISQIAKAHGIQRLRRASVPARTKKLLLEAAKRNESSISIARKFKLPPRWVERFFSEARHQEKALV